MNKNDKSFNLEAVSEGIDKKHEIYVSDDEKIDIAARTVMTLYKEAFSELAK